jgi:hypothetical protein
VELVVHPQLSPGDAREQLDRPVVVGRPQAARGYEQVGAEPIAKRRFELVLSVADDRDPRGLEAELEELAREKGTVSVGPLPADELAAGDDEERPGPRQFAAGARSTPDASTKSRRAGGRVARPLTTRSIAAGRCT